MNQYGLEFLHLGLAVRSPEPALKMLLGLSYQAGDPVRDPLQNVAIRMCCHPVMPTIELVSPTESAGPLDGILRSATSMIYHVCYKTRDAAASVSAMKAAGLNCVTISSPKPGVVFEGRLASFHQVQGFGLIDLIEFPL